MENSKRSPLTKKEHLELATWLHMEILRQIVTVKRWKDSEIVFHGGTSLRLGFGSDRYSEDLDFMINPASKMESLMKNVQKNLQGVCVRYFGDNTVIKMKSRDSDKNPLVFTFSLEIPNKIGSVKVKSEFWQTDFLNQYNTQISRLHQKPRQALSITLQVSPIQFHLPTETQIYADKVFAVINRPYMKFRDMYDLHWLKNNVELSNLKDSIFMDLMKLRDVYPGSHHEKFWPIILDSKIESWKTESFPKDFYLDMKKWLPVESSEYYDQMYFIESSTQLVNNFVDINQLIRSGLSSLNIEISQSLPLQNKEESYGVGEIEC